MRILVPALAFAFSCMGAGASNPSAPSTPLAQAAAPSPPPAADAGVDPVARAQASLDAPRSAPREVASALMFLAKTRGAAAIPAIAAKLGSPDVVVRRAAVAALGTVGGPQARAALQKQLDAETQPEIRDAIERAMAAATP